MGALGPEGGCGEGHYYAMHTPLFASSPSEMGGAHSLGCTQHSRIQDAIL